jgi:hypothetical protein
MAVVVDVISKLRPNEQISSVLPDGGVVDPWATLVNRAVDYGLAGLQSTTNVSSVGNGLHSNVLTVAFNKFD